MSIALYGNINGQSYRPPTINLLDSSKVNPQPCVPSSKKSLKISGIPDVYIFFVH